MSESAYEDYKVAMDAKERFRREMPVWGLRGKVSRATFALVAAFAVALTALVAFGGSGMLSYALPLVLAIAGTLANVFSFGLLPLCVKVTARQIMGPRFPLAAVAWTALTCALTGVAMWLFAHAPTLWDFTGCELANFVRYMIAIAGGVISLLSLERSDLSSDKAIGIDWAAYARDHGWTEDK